MRHILLLLLLAIMPMLCAEPVSLIENGGFNAATGTLSSWEARNGGLGDMIAENGVFTAKIRELSERPWTMELHQLVQPSVPKDAIAVISFEYNISEGYSFNFYWQVEKSPWPKLLSLHLDKADGWQYVKIAVPIHEQVDEKSSALSFHLGGKVGTLELRNISMLLYPAGTSIKSLNANTNAVLGGDFYDNDWREAAIKRLNDVRTKEYTLNWKPNSDIEVRQLNRPFSFGAECPLSVICNTHVKKGLKKDLLPQYCQKVLDPTMFDTITLSDGVNWRDYDQWGKDFIKTAITNLNTMGMKVRGHALFTPAYMFAPVKCRKMKAPALNDALLKHITEAASTPGISEWNVVHGAVDYQEISKFIGLNSVLNVFAIAKEKSPEAKHFLSDVNSLCAMSDASLRDFVEFTKWLIDNGVKLDGIVLGVTVNRPDVAPQSMEKRLDYVQNTLKLPIYISDFAVNADNDEQHDAMMQDYLLLFFSHPGVHGVSFGELWSAARLNPKMGLLDATLQEKKAATTIRKLLTEQWRTNTTVHTDANGNATFRAFYGTYEIKCGDETKQITITE